MGIGKQEQENNLLEWAEQVKACRDSGMTVGAWCEKNGINQSTYYRRQRMVAAMVGDGEPAPLESRSPESNLPAFAEYKLPAISSSGVIKLHFIFGTLEIHNGAEEAVISSTLRAIKSLC